MIRRTDPYEQRESMIRPTGFNELGDGVIRRSGPYEHGGEVIGTIIGSQGVV